MTANNSAARETLEPVQRILLPKRGEPVDVRMLYLIESEQNRERLSWSGRTSVTIPAGEEASFETYFNAFPAAYWRRWSQLKSIVLVMDVEGEANISLYRSKQDGQRISVANHLVGSGHHEFELPLKNFEDGGWLWFDITAEQETTLADAAWCSPHAPGPQLLPDGTEQPAQDKRVAVGIPTFNRPTDAVAALKALAEDPVVDEIIDFVLMPDQGNQHPADEPGYDEAVAHFGERFREFRQGNLGGSGGYSRIMYEALENTESPFILYMDDDIAIEPDSVLRAVQAARYAAKPIIVGGQMLNLQERSQLRTTGEQVNRADFMWARRRTPSTTTTLPSTRCAPSVTPSPTSTRRSTTPARCTAASTWNTTAGGCASSRASSRRASGSRCRCSSSGMTPNTPYVQHPRASPR